jgi:hypothetical protein
MTRTNRPRHNGIKAPKRHKFVNDIVHLQHKFKYFLLTAVEIYL